MAPRRATPTWPEITALAEVFRTQIGGCYAYVAAALEHDHRALKPEIERTTEPMSEQFKFQPTGPLGMAERNAAEEAARLAAIESRPRTPKDVQARPLATHRIEDGRAVCDGDSESRCHWYPGCDDHDSWPCGCEYVVHDECWMMPWLNSTDLEDSAYDEALERRDPESLKYPDGEIEPEWEGEFVMWDYAEDAATPSPETEKSDR